MLVLVERKWQNRAWLGNTASFTLKSISIPRHLLSSQTICMINVKIPIFDGDPQAGQLKINEALFPAVGTIKYNVLLTKVERTPSSACCRRERNESQSFFRRTKTADKPAVVNKDSRRLLSSLVLILKVTLGISIVRRRNLVPSLLF